MYKPSASEFFGPWEPPPIASWSDFQAVVNELTDRYAKHRLLWRGARNADWGVFSSLYRVLRDELGGPPSEQQMVNAEKRILELARRDWRFDGKPALEVFAELQHVGGPTRLLDVTENPLVALWFASEAPVRTTQVREQETDGRIVAFVAPFSGDLGLDGDWRTREPRWHGLRDDAHRAARRWGTGRGRRYWRPPVYHARIAAQSAGFLIDGVPVEAARSELGWQAPTERNRWQVDQMREVSSMPLQLTRSQEGNLPADRNPVFTFRITAEAKRQTRAQLENRYGIRDSTMYPDLVGFADYLSKRPKELRGLGG